MELGVLKAYAKLNLTLDVLRPRRDGYYDLCMVMQSVSLYDTIYIARNNSSSIRAKVDLEYVPGDERNHAVLAAMELCARAGREVPGILLNIEKRIPVCAGMGGGSADAAAVLGGLNQLLDIGFGAEGLREIGLQIGSDVPFCLTGGSMLVTGRGEELTPLPPMPPCHIVLCKPDFFISTGEMFRKLNHENIRSRPDTKAIVRAFEGGDLRGIGREVRNVFEETLPPAWRGEVERIKGKLRDFGACGAGMSGTGSTVFGLFECNDAASRAKESLRKRYQAVFLGNAVSKGWEIVRTKCP